MKPTTPKPAIIGVTDTPTCDSATSTPTRNTIVPAIEISISFNSWEIDWSECLSARSVTRRAMRASQRAVIKIAINRNTDSNVPRPCVANQSLNLAVASA